MQCTNPYWLPKQQIEVPCGKCRPCRINRANDWTTRMMHEAATHEHSMFITLTYDEDHLPWQLNKRDPQLFLKKLRKRLDHKIKYFLGAEYGEHTYRPHYHLIMFGIRPCEKCRVCTKLHTGTLKPPKPGTDCYALEQAWGMGIITGGTVTTASARYVADYIQKDTRPETYDGRQPPFSLMSKGIGRQWQQDNINLQTCFLGLNQGTRRVPVPRYYQKKVIDDSGQDSEQVKFLIQVSKQRHSQRIKESREEFWNQRDTPLIHGIITSTFQAEREIQAKDRLREAKL